MAHQRARVDVLNDRNVVAFKIGLRSFTRTPVGGEHGKLADDQAFDVGLRRFLILEVGAHIANMRIGDAHDLPGVAGIGEYFLIAGEAGIKNDFAATAGTSSRRATVKYSSVLERKNRASCGGLVCVSSRRCHLDAALTVEDE